MRVLGQPAFVLHARAWRETSLIVDLLTRDHGRIGVVARGVNGPRKHLVKAALQPLQFVRLDYVLRGELGHLNQVEALDPAPRLSGDALMSAFYVNELLLKLVPRDDPVPEIYDLYARVRSELSVTPSLSWLLRRFERDLLEGLGVGLSWANSSDGCPIDGGSWYRIDPQQGAILNSRGREEDVSGHALLSLLEDKQPSALHLSQLRQAMRTVLASHVGPGGLKCWGFFDELARVRPVVQT